MIKVLFIGDIFGLDSVVQLENFLPRFIKEQAIDFVIAQGENVSDRKGLIYDDYFRLRNAGIDALTMGNHIWAKEEILSFIKYSQIIRPYNVKKNYPGSGSMLFKVKGKTIRVTSMLGIDFNELRTNWNEPHADSFFDAFDELIKEDTSDFHILDFHAETTSEKAVFGLYVDGKVSALLGTHTHVQTNDARALPRHTLFVSDVGMTGPMNSAIGADFEAVYQKMRFAKKARFITSNNPIQFNAVILTLFNKSGAQNKIELVHKTISPFGNT